MIFNQWLIHSSRYLQRFLFINRWWYIDSNHVCLMLQSESILQQEQRWQRNFISHFHVSSNPLKFKHLYSSYNIVNHHHNLQTWSQKFYQQDRCREHWPVREAEVASDTRWPRQALKLYPSNTNTPFIHHIKQYKINIKFEWKIQAENRKIKFRIQSRPC